MATVPPMPPSSTPPPSSSPLLGSANAIPDLDHSIRDLLREPTSTDDTSHTPIPHFPDIADWSDDDLERCQAPVQQVSSDQPSWVQRRPPWREEELQLLIEMDSEHVRVPTMADRINELRRRSDWPGSKIERTPRAVEKKLTNMRNSGAMQRLTRPGRWRRADDVKLKQAVLDTAGGHVTIGKKGHGQRILQQFPGCSWDVIKWAIRRLRKAGELPTLDRVSWSPGETQRLVKLLEQQPKLSTLYVCSQFPSHSPNQVMRQRLNLGYGMLRHLDKSFTPEELERLQVLVTTQKPMTNGEIEAEFPGHALAAVIRKARSLQRPRERSTVWPAELDSKLREILLNNPSQALDIALQSFPQVALSKIRWKYVAMRYVLGRYGLLDLSKCQQADNPESARHRGKGVDPSMGDEDHVTWNGFLQGECSDVDEDSPDLLSDESAEESEDEFEDVLAARALSGKGKEPSSESEDEFDDVNVYL